MRSAEGRGQSESIGMTIIIDTGSLARSPSGAITGTIYLQSGDLAFPEVTWNDFPAVLLGWWLDALGRLIAGERSQSLRFMDGPYRVDLSLSEQQVVTVRFILEAEEQVLGETHVDAASLLGSASRAARDLITACEAQGWSSHELQHLEEALART